MRLRPRHVDNFRSTVAPTFSVDPHTATGLYSALHAQFAGINGIPVVTPTERLVQAVMAAVPGADRQPPFNDAKISHIASICAQQAQRLFSQDMDFQRNTSGAVIDLAYFTNTLATLSADPAQHTAADLSDIVDGIIQSAASSLDTQIAASPFHVAHINTADAKERLSIITQFFLAQTNIYCVAKSLTPPRVNFGTILDGNAALSSGVAVCVATSLANNQPVEDALLDFVANTPAFQLRAGANTFTAVRRQEIKQRFNSQFNTIQGSPHFDEFMVLEQTRRGPFTEHQGAICVDFKDLVKELRIQPRDAATWSLRHGDTFGLNPAGLAILPHQNPQIEVVCVELTAAKLNARIQGYLRQPATLDTLAEFLLTDVITGSHSGPAAAAAGETRQKLFATLDQQTINLITSSSHWGALRTLITAKTTQELRLAFEQQFQCVDVDVVLTEQMCCRRYKNADIWRSFMLKSREYN